LYYVFDELKRKKLYFVFVFDELMGKELYFLFDELMEKIYIGKNIA
jgi:hypothetical protein